MTEAQQLSAHVLEGFSPKEFLARPSVRANKPTIDQVRFAVYHEPEDMFELHGSFDDPEDIAEIRRQLRQGNSWAWCRVEVKAWWRNRYTLNAYTGSAYLGGCSYESEEAFTQSGDYLDSMKQEAYDDLISNIEAGNIDPDF